MRGLWKSDRGIPDLKAKMEARKARALELAEKHQFAADNLSKQLTDKFEQNFDNMMAEEEKKNEMRRRLIKEKLDQIQLDPERIQKRVQGNMLNKWEHALGGGGASAPPGGAGPSRKR